MAVIDDLAASLGYRPEQAPMGIEVVGCDIRIQAVSGYMKPVMPPRTKVPENGSAPLPTGSGVVYNAVA
ncbi:MAG: hypothetical protein H0V37_09010 [Chloroflexia bacterium]|nr:hypothetical protein [Chloroflexia bacterium]